LQYSAVQRSALRCVTYAPQFVDLIIVEYVVGKGHGSFVGLRNVHLEQYSKVRLVTSNVVSVQCIQSNSVHCNTVHLILPQNSLILPPSLTPSLSSSYSHPLPLIRPVASPFSVSCVLSSCKTLQCWAWWPREK
jgi:hypothetical protein